MADRRARLSRVVCRWLKRLMVTAILIQLCLYANDVHTRWMKRDTCDWSPVKDRHYELDPPPPYLARYCYVGKDEIWLQLYDASGSDLLAERMYYDLLRGSFFWTVEGNDLGTDALLYTRMYGDSGYGEISIPPTLMDRWLATLP